MSINQIEVEGQRGFDNHKAVYELKKTDGSLLGFVAIHDDKLGPAVGGTRMFAYPTTKDALVDVLRLSNAMSYKCALAGVNYGGGKGVIIGDPQKDKDDSLLKEYAQNILELNGTFFTGEDVGISEEDVQSMLQGTPYFIGKSGLAGDPSPYAALSTFYSIKAANKIVNGSENLDGFSVAIKGVGKVGSALAKLLADEGADIYLSDIDKSAINTALEKIPKAKKIDNSSIAEIDVDIFSPCALGDDITSTNVNNIKAGIICGAANNQLENLSVGDKLKERNILYVVDYVANCGGLINVVDELEEGGYNHDRVMSRIANVSDTIKMLYDISSGQNIAIQRAADELAKQRIRQSR